MTVIPLSMVERNLQTINQAIDELGGYPDPFRSSDDEYRAYHDRVKQIVDWQSAGMHEALERRSTDLLADTRALMCELVLYLVLESKFHQSQAAEHAAELDFRDGNL